MKTKLLFPLCFLTAIVQMQAQDRGKSAFMHPDGTFTVEAINLPYSSQKTQTSEFDLLWRYGNVANPTFKNSRGVTLADLDNDGNDEVLYGINKTLYAFNGDGSILWERTLSGIITLPPTAVDLDGDGTIEIVVNTGGSPPAGRVYLLDSQGNDLPGWPLNFDNHWMINAPAVSDLDGDGTMEIITGERVTSNEGHVHALKMDGTPLNVNWPVTINATPAFTPSIGDVNGDGELNIVIAASQGTMYVFDLDGQPIDGFPVTTPNVSYSYQSPILADLDGEGKLSIIGSNHGDNPGFYVMEHDGTYREGWPIPLEGWTYSPPTVVDSNLDGSLEIYMADRLTNFDRSPRPTIYGFDPDGNNLPNFPLDMSGGTEGVISVADVNNDGVMDIIFPSTITDDDGYGYLHAYSLDGSGAVDGFPLRPYGFTYMNGAVLGDVNGDGMMDITYNSYTLFDASGVDSTWVQVRNLNVPFNPEKILRNGYKGDNTRDGLVDPEVTVGISNQYLLSGISIFPNPSEGILHFKLKAPLENGTLSIFTLDGKVVYKQNVNWQDQAELDMKHLKTGFYIVMLSDGKRSYVEKWIRN